MKNQDLNISYTVEATPAQVFDAITNVRAWWSHTLEGDSAQLNDEFTYRYKDIHYSKQRVVEVIPNKRIVWLVTDSSLSFIKQKDEWTGTKVIFDISEEDGKTQLHFTHLGLTPGSECFEACTNGWGTYADKSLRSLITTGKGQPN